MTRPSVKSALIATFCAISLISAAASASEAEASKWTVRLLPPKQLEGGSANQAVLSGVSCPSVSLCVAVGALDTVAFSQTPTGEADRWHVGYPTYDEPKQSCLEEEGVPPASCSFPRGSLDAVSCPTEGLCVAVGYEGSVYVSNDPAGSAGSWSVTDLNEPGSAKHLTAVSCPSVSLCVAVSGGYGGAAGSVLTSIDPASGRWQAARLGGAPDLRGVSCATPSLCVAVAKDGRIFVSANPTGGATAWRETGSPTPRDLLAVSCVDALLCAAGDAGGNVLTSTDPMGGGGFTETDADGSVQITGFTCPATQRCVAVTNNADVLTSIDPTGGPSSWTLENLVPFEVDKTGANPFVNNALFGASCASTSLCALVGANSRIFTATEPFAEPAPSRNPRKRTRLRPRTILLFAEDFWKLTMTRRHHVKARFRFYSRDGARRFLCKPDRDRWRRCHSPLRYRVGIGRHELHVRAIGRTGLRGPVTGLRFSVSHPLAADRAKRTRSRCESRPGPPSARNRG
jgi:hypothetical protein